MIDNLKLDMDAYLPLRDVVFNTLREAILKGDLLPGERLMEIALANQLGVSRTPIREAIRMLEQEGLAITIPRKGAIVAGMSQTEMEEVLEIREALEQLSVQVACDKIDETQLEELKEAQKHFEKMLETGDLKKIAQADIEFHNIIYRATYNKRLILMLEGLREQVYRYRVEYLKDASNYEEVLKEHEAIYEALAHRDKESVTEMTRKHIQGQAKAVNNIIANQRK